MDEAPIYITGDPEEYAEGQRARLIALGMSDKNAAAHKARLLKRIVQVGSGYEANAIQSGRGS